MSEQNYGNHPRYVPGYHFVALGILTINFLWSLFRLFWSYEGYVKPPLFDRILSVLVAGALLGIALYARTFALKVQDRVIRNEMLARLAAVLPADLRPRTGELRANQLIALRFANDEELPDLTRRTLGGEFARPNDIKRAIRSWRADTFRA